MARRQSLLTLLSAAGIAGIAIAQPPQPGPPTALERPPGERPKPPILPTTPDGPRRFFHHSGPEADAMRERAMRELQKLSPEQRADIWKAVWAVLNLPPEKRQMILGMDENRRKVAREEIERAMSDAGLQLDEEKKKRFVGRYFEERRTIEEKLRKESEEKRRHFLGEMRARLKQEFETVAVKPAPGEGSK
jgi:hypothetical protein